MTGTHYASEARGIRRVQAVTFTERRTSTRRDDDPATDALHLPDPENAGKNVHPTLNQVRHSAGNRRELDPRRTAAKWSRWTLALVCVVRVLVLDGSWEASSVGHG